MVDVKERYTGQWWSGNNHLAPRNFKSLSDTALTTKHNRSKVILISYFYVCLPYRTYVTTIMLIIFQSFLQIFVGIDFQGVLVAFIYVLLSHALNIMGTRMSFCLQNHTFDFWF